MVTPEELLNVDHLSFARYEKQIDKLLLDNKNVFMQNGYIEIEFTFPSMSIARIIKHHYEQHSKFRINLTFHEAKVNTYKLEFYVKP